MRLIDADALMRQLEKKRSEPGKQRYTKGFNDALMRFRSMIHSAPTIEAEPVRHGRWEEEDERSAYKDFLVSCSECGAFLDERNTSHFRYCYKCGAKMEGE